MGLSSAISPIVAGPPSVTSHAITVADVGDRVVVAVSVTVELEHDWHGDLALSLLAPGGTRVVLARRRGGDAGHFRRTTFDADAPVAIANAVPPFDDPVRPLGDLADLHRSPADGTWTLEVDDRAFHGGGAIRGWGLAIELGLAADPAFLIDVRFGGGLTAAQQTAFTIAAARWSQIITADVPAVLVAGETIDDLVVDASGTAIDGRGGILGRAGPTQLRPGSFLPAAGVMEFDVADLATMERDGSLVSVIVHEMGHVLGLGTIWDELGLRQGAGSVNPVFTGARAIGEFTTLTGSATPRAVPLANVGGPGTRDAHWRESVFGNELMTGFLDPGPNPLSRLTIAALADMGYEVDLGAADPYVLPGALELALLGVGTETADHGGRGVMLVPPKRVLPYDALI